MDKIVFFEVLVPLMEIAGTATICISTPLGSGNFYSELTRLVDDKGRPIFNVKHIGKEMRPPWKPLHTYNKVKAIFGSNSAMRRRELDGEITDGEGAAFLKPTLDTLFTRPRITDLSRIAENVIYVCVDPNGGATLTGGPGSDTAIVSFAVSSGMFVIVGLESFATRDHNQPYYLVSHHIAGLRNVFPGRRFRLIVEFNESAQANLICEQVLGSMSDVDIICSTTTSYGVYTPPGIKARYVFRVRQLLRNDAVALYTHIVSCSPYQPGSHKELAESNLKRFEHQMRSFRPIYTLPTRAGGKVGVTFSGKVDHNGKFSASQQDDVTLAFIFGVFYAIQTMSDPRLTFIRTVATALTNTPPIMRENR